ADANAVTDAMNELVAVAERAMADAALRVKEIEIQLKVRTADRQHPEAIIYSISDAVLVTDPFDDLVLANESAARAFGFDLSNASRAPMDQAIGDEKVISLIREMRQSNSASGRRIVEHTVKAGNVERTYKITLSCVADKSNQSPARVGAVLHDLTKEEDRAREN